MRYQAIKISRDKIELINELTDIEIGALNETFQATNPKEHVFYFVLENRPDGWTNWQMLPEKYFHRFFEFIEQEKENEFAEVLSRKNRS